MAISSVKFERPPVIELVLGVQFNRIKGFTSSHFGWFWKRYLEEEWVNAADTFPIPDQFEFFGDRAGGTPDLNALFSQGPYPGRIQLSTESSERMIQVQATRFHYNWQKKGQAYPSYHQVRKDFDLSFEKFRRFVTEAKDLGELQPNQWEITYVNHIPKGELWAEPKDWSRVLPGLLGSSRDMKDVALESVGGEWHFELQPQKGRLHFAVQYGRVGEKAEPTLILNATARGAIEEDTDLGAGLTFGHERIIHAFLQVTSPEAQKVWKKVGQ